MDADQRDCRAVLYAHADGDDHEVYVHAGDLADHLEAFARKAELNGLSDDTVAAIRASMNLVLDYAAMALRNPQV